MSVGITLQRMTFLLLDLAVIGWLIMMSAEFIRDWRNDRQTLKQIRLRERFEKALDGSCLCGHNESEHYDVLGVCKVRACSCMEWLSVDVEHG